MKFLTIRMTNFSSVDEGTFGVEQVTCLVDKNEPARVRSCWRSLRLNCTLRCLLALTKSTTYLWLYLVESCTICLPRKTRCGA